MHNNKIQLCKDTIDESDLIDLSNWIRSNQQLTKGELTQKFEIEFSKKIGSDYSVYVNSGSSANLMILYALELSGFLKSKNIICPSISWSTTVAPAIQLGFNINLCDCDQDDLGIDLNHLEYLCKKHNPEVLFIVHVLGHPNKIKEIQAICDRYSVILIEDSCESLGSIYEQKHVGTFGLGGTFSLYYSHQISTIEGGFITVNDRKLYNLLLSIRSHGWSRDLQENIIKDLEKKYYVDKFRALYTFYYPGFNFRSTDLNAYIGLKQIKKLEEIVKIRQSNFNYYKELLNNDYWYQNSGYTRLSNFGYATLARNRFEVYEKLKSMDIETRPLVAGNIGRQPFWIDKFGELKLTNADIVHDYGIYLPNHQGLSTTDIEYVVGEFKKIAEPMFFK